MRIFGRAASFVLVAALTSAVPSGQSRRPAPAAPDLRSVREYIARTWTTLTRSARDLPRAARDPKLHGDPAQRSQVYVSRHEDQSAIERRLQDVLTADERRSIELRVLPERVEDIREHGLLYLPHPYVVPGGRFNEMYGWDSYFIQIGLLRDGRLDLARSMTDNFLYEIAQYRTILNANRTYFLTRSQPPFLTEMILGVFEKTGDRAWLGAAVPAIEKYYAFWTTAPHLIESTGLSRYFDAGEGPAPEVLADERDAQGRTHYDRVREYYRAHPALADYDVSAFYDRSADRLTDLFYKGDRSMRESGFDPSNRFGPFSADIIHYAPVCLNTLLYRMERDGARIAAILGQSPRAAEWEARAARRRELIDRYLWDPAAGLYFDYNFQTGRRRPYPFATTFYPLWAGAASPAQARAVARNLPRFEAPGGLLTSTEVTGSQWDAPFGWAPLQIIGVAGLRRYGYHAEADRVARKFVSLVAEDFAAHGTIVEKYDVRRRSSDLGAGLRFGYTSNEVGFGWTNAAVLDLLAGLDERTPASPRARPRLEISTSPDALGSPVQNVSEDWSLTPEAYFLTPEERAAWKQLESEDAREQFTAAYWQRRNPRPAMERNEFKELVLARIRTADSRFTIGKTAGSRAARGRVFVVLGPPAVERQTVGPLKSAPEMIAPGRLSIPPDAFETREWHTWVYDREHAPELLQMLGRASIEISFIVEPGRKDSLQDPDVFERWQKVVARGSIRTSGPRAARRGECATGDTERTPRSHGDTENFGFSL